MQSTWSMQWVWCNKVLHYCTYVHFSHICTNKYIYFQVLFTFTPLHILANVCIYLYYIFTMHCMICSHGLSYCILNVMNTYGRGTGPLIQSEQTGNIRPASCSSSTSKETPGEVDTKWWVNITMQLFSVASSAAFFINMRVCINHVLN